MAKYRHVPWKRNIIKLPPRVAEQLNNAPDEDYVVGVVKSFSKQAIQEGVLSHLGIASHLTEYPHRALPPEDMGRYSKKNVQGWAEKRRDLPKESFTTSFEAPNFGDSSKGTHTVNWTRERFRRDYIEPPTFEICVECLSKSDDGGRVLKFTVDTPQFSGTPSERHATIMFALNLLQENVGGCGIWPRSTSTADLMSTYVLDWEFFPQGERLDMVVQKLSFRLRNVTPAIQGIIEERAKLFRSLGGDLLMGSSGFNRYLGAKFADDLVVFENIQYGNALYVLYEDWRIVSRKSRIELLKATNKHIFERFIHRDGWISRFMEHINAERAKRQKPKAA